ncbi:MAG: DEAD/DEAH box helicase [Pirellulaceae bacterium]|nr:DEAD/DEAH box helicase [Pirellulaceae bacterium]
MQTPPGEFWSWRLDVPSDAAAHELRPPVSLFATGWQTALSRPCRIKTQTLPLDATPPAVVSLLVQPPRLKTISLAFEPPEPGPIGALPARPPREPAPSLHPAQNQRPGKTRVAPPKDIVKLEDRLFYLLQPPLESLLHNGTLELPFEPFPYQYEGIAFLYPRYAAILADEMGLGKTMQAVTTIRLLLRSGELRSVLLICPKPLVTNWQREFAQWAPEIALGVIQGDRTRREFQWQQQRAPVKIANYELLMRDRDLLESGQLHFDLVVLDEAQRIKNRSSTTSQIVHSIPRSRSWALTGTPVENSSEDLVGIFEFLSPGYLKSGTPAPQMGEAIRDFILRRTKEMVLTDLPPKMFRDAELSLTAEQWATYKTAEDDGVVQLTDMGEEVTIQHVFELVLRLKQICNFDPATGASAKLERLEADLEEVAASGQKAIVFSQWVGSLQQMNSQLERFGPLQYHGGIPPRRRDDVIRTFREDRDRHVLLMSYGAGAVGLNLQFCGYVFLFDRWWNPAVEDQAINRAHRIGASGPVTVTRMLTLDTIEERINQILEEKRQLFQDLLLTTGKPTSRGLTQDEVFGLFNLRTPARRAVA